MKIIAIGIIISGISLANVYEETAYDILEAAWENSKQIPDPTEFPEHTTEPNPNFKCIKVSKLYPSRTQESRTFVRLLNGGPIFPPHIKWKVMKHFRASIETAKKIAMRYSNSHVNHYLEIYTKRREPYSYHYWRFRQTPEGHLVFSEESNNRGNIRAYLGTCWWDRELDNDR